MSGFSRLETWCFVIGLGFLEAPLAPRPVLLLVEFGENVVGVHPIDDALPHDFDHVMQEVDPKARLIGPVG